MRAHTNHLVYTGPEIYPSREDPLVAEILGAPHGPSISFSGTPAGFHPADFQRAYGDHSPGGGIIAIVDAYHDPNSLPDFNTFSREFGLPTESSATATATANHVFQVVYAAGSKPGSDGGWSQEISLDIEWAHAMAPSAKIVLVEANSSNYTDLMKAVDAAAALPGVIQVSMSWGGTEFAGEASYDSHFNHAGITFFASSGDVGGARDYPAMSPNLVAVGGTSLILTASSSSEKGWAGSGGGVSQIEKMPTYQGAIASILGARRGSPDISADADPNTGGAVYDSYAYQGFVGWFVVGGTSLACPVCAGIANAGGAHRGSTEQAFIYAHGAGFNDITKGTAGANACKAGWDFVTGWGSPGRRPAFSGEPIGDPLARSLQFLSYSKSAIWRISIRWCSRFS